MVVTTKRTPQENTVQSPTDNDDVEHSSLDSVSPTVPEDTPADNEVFHDTKDSIDAVSYTHLTLPTILLV